MCLRVCFQEDLIVQLVEWKEDGDRLIVVLDTNHNIYRNDIRKALTDGDGLDMTKAVWAYTGK